jgi:hypothetical protein
MATRTMLRASVAHWRPRVTLCTTRRGLAVTSRVPDPTPSERLAFIREMSSKKKQPEPEPEPEQPAPPPPPPWASRSQSGSAPARHQTAISDRRQSWYRRSTAAAANDERINAALATLFDESST